MKLTIENKTSSALGAFGSGFVKLITQLEGRKGWKKDRKTYWFETTTHNLRLFQSVYPDCQITDNRKDLSAFDFGQGLVEVAVGPSRESKLASQLANLHSRQNATPRPNLELYADLPFKVEPFPYQLECFHKAIGKNAFAYFAEQGTGKTKMVIDQLCYRFTQGLVSSVLIFTNTRDVSWQWAEDALPKMVWDGIEWTAQVWNGKKLILDDPDPGKMQFFFANIDSLKVKRAVELFTEFCTLHESMGLAIGVDESQTIKNKSTARAERLIDLAGSFNTQFKFIMTGTPIARDLTDEWSQLYFLDPSILGMKYKTAFQAMFCEMGPSDDFGNKPVVGYKNIDRFRELVDPYTFRATKEDDLGLPPKIYKQIVFTMSKEQQEHIISIKQNFMTMVREGVATVKFAATAMLRIQQISCGFLEDDDGTLHFFDNPRIEALDRVIESRSGAIVIWARFKRDIETICNHLGEEATAYHGGMSQTQRQKSKSEFIAGHARFFVANPAAAGTGIDGLQKVSDTAVYYSNSFNAIERWQSEDRTHRIGMMNGTCTYFDLIARGSLDRRLINSTNQKKSVSEMAIGDFEKMLADIPEGIAK